MILRLLHESLREDFQPVYIVLVLDMAAPPVVESVTELAMDLHTISLFIPAKLTWLLQPLDAYVFQAHKNNLRSAYVRVRCEAQCFGVLTKAEWLRSVFQSCHRTFTSKDFSKAFK